MKRKNGKKMEDCIMKKVLFALAALALLASCNKEFETPDNTIPETTAADEPVKICFDIASPGDDAATKAVKQGWETGDCIYIWFNDVFVDKTATSQEIRECDLRLRYDGTKWNDEYQVAGLADALAAKAGGTLEYFEDTNGNGVYDAGIDVLKSAYKGSIYALWVSGNNLMDASGGWTTDVSHPVDGHNYLFPQPACFIKPENTSPMVLTSGFTSSSGYSGGGIDYLYYTDSNTLTLVSAISVSTPVQLTWKFYTNFQITVTGLEPGHVYSLKSPQFGKNFMYVGEVDGRMRLTRMINAGSESANFGLEEYATADSGGEAVFFGQGMEITSAIDFTFTLKDVTAGKTYTCTKTGKTLACGDTKLAAIKLKFYDFNHWTVVGAFNGWGSDSVIYMKRTSAPDYNADPRNGDWEADIIGYEAGQGFKLYFNKDYTQGEAGMKSGWASYALGDWGDNTNYLSGDSDMINIKIAAGDGNYHLFFSYPSHWFVITKID